MESKKAQSELITTVLIILLVLAAIIIVWQVVVGVLNQGKENVEDQQGCIGFSATVALASNKSTVNFIPNKDIAGWRVFVNGAKVGGDGAAVTQMSSGSWGQATAIAQNSTIKVAGKIGENWCDGMSQIVVP